MANNQKKETYDAKLSFVIDLRQLKNIIKLSKVLIKGNIINFEEKMSW